jgi:ABC-type glucose/galactose transport system permease subunit
MAAVGTLPELVALPGEDQAVFDIFQQLAIAGLVGFFDLGDAFKQGCDLVKALGAGVGGDFNGAVCSIIGGNALYGGHGGMVQVFIGTVTFGLISNILQLFGLSTAVQYIVQGAILLLAINLDNLKKR